MECNKTSVSNNQTVKEMERLKVILDSVSSAVFEISDKGDILFANQAAMHIFGYERIEFMQVDNSNTRQHGCTGLGLIDNYRIPALY
jgi:PAS domain-containing protein